MMLYLLAVRRKKRWIPNDVLYGPINQGGFNMIQIKDFFHVLKLKWIQIYLSGIHDHWADIIDRSLTLGPKNLNILLEWGSNHPKINGISQFTIYFIFVHGI